MRVDRPELYVLRSLPAANITNMRGRRTWEWKMPDGTQISVYFRHGGERFASHFHKGEDPSKNPERLLLITGTVRIEVLDQAGDERQETLVAGCPTPVELVIQPWVLHRMQALNHCIYIEYRTAYFDPLHPDTYPACQFPYQFQSDPDW